MTWLVWTPDPLGRYKLAGQPATLRVRQAIATKPLPATGGTARLTGSAARLRHRRAYMRQAYALAGAPAELRRRA